MSYHGDIALGETIDIKFTTVNTSGVPTTLAGSPVVSAYPDNSTTELTTGITLTVNFDSRTGLHNVRVVATSGNGYAAGTNYTLVITTGTVDGNSVVGYVIGSFSIEQRSALRPATAGRTLAVESDGMAHADVKEWLGTAPNALASGRVDASVGAMANNVVTAAAIATDAITADKIAADAIGSSELAASAVAEIQSGLATATGVDAAEAAILAAIEAALSDTSRPAPTAPPAFDAPLAEKIGWLYARERHVRIQNIDGTETLRNAANDGDIGTRTNTDDMTEAVKGEWS